MYNILQSAHKYNYLHNCMVFFIKYEGQLVCPMPKSRVEKYIKHSTTTPTL